MKLELRAEPRKAGAAKGWPLRLLGLAGGTSLLGGLSLAYAYYIEPYWLDVSYQKVPILGTTTSSAWRGFRLALLTDLHMGTRSDPFKTLIDAVERVVALKPDLVLLNGDYFTKGKWNPKLAQLLQPLLDQNLNVVGIMGNHDYYGRRSDPERIIEGLRQAGVKVLRNQALPLHYNGAQAWLVGLDDCDRGEPDLAEATRDLAPGEKPLIVAVHNPNYVPELPAHYTELVLSGHTHGGQINPALGPLKDRLNWVRYTLSDHRTRFPLGWYRVNGNRLYVCRGLGMSGLKLRFNARPELAVFEFV